MMMKRIAAVATATSILACAVGVQAQGYAPSALQRRVDASFSNTPTNTELRSVQSRMQQVGDQACAPGTESEECNWVDTTGTVHVFVAGPRANSYLSLIKIVEAERFRGRPIAALGIGTARTQAEVLANVRRFLGSAATVSCDGTPSGNVGPVECGITLSPGWVQIGFTNEGQLQAVRFDAYQFN